MKNNKDIIEIDDYLEFNFVVEFNGQKMQNAELVKIFVGGNEFFENFDDAIINKEINKNKKVNFEFRLPSNADYFPGEIVNFEMDILKHKKAKKDTTKEIKIINKLNEELAKENKVLKDKINEMEKLFLEKAKELEIKSQAKIDNIKLLEREKTQSEIDNIKKYSLQKIIEDIISPLNNLENAISFGVNKGSQEIMAYAKGFSLLVSQIFSILENYGVKEIVPKINEEFNPKLHHIIEINSDKNIKSNHIIEIKDKGFILNDRVIKPALVIVSK
ncbi:MAG: nucleotide exchange factor GrpE [Metamycoplasmataceae bacterium]